MWQSSKRLRPNAFILSILVHLVILFGLFVSFKFNKAFQAVSQSFRYNQDRISKNRIQVSFIFERAVQSSKTLAKSMSKDLTRDVTKGFTQGFDKRRILDKKITRFMETHNSLSDRNPIQAPSGALDFSDASHSLSPYFSLILRRIEAVLDYPYSLRRKKIQGQVGIKLVLTFMGVVESCEIRESSGSKELDQLAMNAVERAGPFPNLPLDLIAELKQSGKIQFNLPISFKLE